MQDGPHEAPGGVAPAPEKRLSTAWRTRRRYKVAQWLLTLAGLAAAIAVVAASVAGLPDARTALGRGFVVQSAMLVLVAGLVPWVGLGVLGRRAWRRNL